MRRAMKESHKRILAACLAFGAVSTWAPGLISAGRGNSSSPKLHVSEVPALAAPVVAASTPEPRTRETSTVPGTLDLAAALEATLSEARDLWPARGELDLEALARTWKGR